MTKPRILIQLDTDPQPSVFDAVVAVDSGVDRLLRHGRVSPENVRDLVYGAIFTRGPKDLANTAIFVGGSDVAAGDALLAAVQATFFGPTRVSVMMDANGANTTAAAAVLAVLRHIDAAASTVTVLGATGPVGQRVVRLLAGEGVAVRVGSRSEVRAAGVCDSVRTMVPEARLSAHATATPADTAVAMSGAAAVVSAGAIGVTLLPGEVLRASDALRVAVDLNAVPPLGIDGIEATDTAANRDGILGYGALGVGGDKMKIHKAAVDRLFAANDQVFDAETILAIGREVIRA